MKVVTKVRIRIKPNSKIERVRGVGGDGAIEIAVKEPPVEGKANRALKKTLSKLLRVPTNQIEIVAGRTSKLKVVKIEGLNKEEVFKRLGL